MPCVGIEDEGAPLPDQFELTIFGPGYGECVALHLGEGKWAIIDSCLNPRTGNPAALEYLAAIGIDSGESVKAVIATHWDDDHILGLSRIIAQCAKAELIISSAFSTAEFLAYVTRYAQPRGIRVRSGVREMNAVLQIMRETGRRIIRALVDRTVVVYGAPPFPVELITLSPSDEEVDNAIVQIAALIPQAQATKRVSVARRPNHLSVVTLGRIGDFEFLLGGDLEEDGNPRRGWSHILNHSMYNASKSSIFKIPHHGSGSADHAGIWDRMLIPGPLAVTTPWSRAGRRLPASADVIRVLGHTDFAFLTATHADGRAKKRSPGVTKKIKTSVRDIRRVDAYFGAIRLRVKPGIPSLPLSVELFGSAAHFGAAA